MNLFKGIYLERSLCTFWKPKSQNEKKNFSNVKKIFINMSYIYVKKKRLPQLYAIFLLTVAREFFFSNWHCERYTK